MHDGTEDSFFIDTNQVSHGTPGMQWLKLYAEFATDPKVQAMPEIMQRRFIMILCLQCSGDLGKLDDDELALALRISAKELEKTREIFRKKGFIGDDWTPRNFEKRQASQDRTAAERMRRYRVRLREHDRNVTPNVARNALRELEEELEQESFFHASTHTREGRDLDDWKEAIAELQGSEITRLIAAQLQEHATVPSVQNLEAWRFIHAAHVLNRPSSSKTWEYFMGIARKCSRRQFDAWHNPPTAEAPEANGAAPREPPKPRFRNAPQMTPEQRKALRDSLPDDPRDVDQE